MLRNGSDMLRSFGDFVKRAAWLPSEGRRWFFWGALGLLLALIVVYAPVVHCGFIWDDDDHVTQNLLLTARNGLWRIWTDPSAFHQYYPLTLTSFWIERQIFGLNPAGYHVVNVALHGGVSVLLWLILRRLEVRGAWICALVFCLHPIQVESVAWITERKNVLSGLLYLASAWFYLDYWDKQGHGTPNGAWRAWTLAFTLFVLALLAKSVAATLPAALLLVVYWKRGQIGSSELRPLLPFFVLGIGFGLFASYLEGAVVGADRVDWGLTAFDRVLLSGRIAWTYVGHLLLPTRQMFFYPKWVVDPAAPATYLWTSGVLVVLAILWGARHRLGRGPLCAVLYFLGTIFPVLGFINVYPMQFSYVADHFQYLGGIGIICLAVPALLRLTDTLCRGAWRKLCPAFLALGLAIGLGVLTSKRIPVYRNEETLWRDTITQNPTAIIAYKNLGNYLFDQQRFAEAIALTQRVVAADPADVNAWLTLGAALDNAGRSREAMAMFERALALDPANTRARLNLALVCESLQQFEDADKGFAQAVRMAPAVTEAHYEYALYLARRQRKAEAIEHLLIVLRLAPESADARAALDGLLRD